MKSVPRAMTVAGSDSGAGAGIQADLKTFAAMGVYGTSVITAVTAQNTLGVTEVLELPVGLVVSQLEAVVSDIGTDVVKTGMLANSEIIKAVADKIFEHRLARVVVDPVMVAKGGDRLLQEQAIETLRSVLIPLAQVITPNIPEAEVLTNRRIESLDDMRIAARELVDMGARTAVVKGGHLEGPPTDIMYDGEEIKAFTSPRIETTNTHGTGCTFASAIAAGIAKGLSVRDAVTQAKRYVSSSIRYAFPVGHGHGPLNHFHAYWEKQS